MMEGSASSYPFTLVCPLCQGKLEFAFSRITCLSCGEEFGYVDGIPDLIRGGQFEDDYDPDRNLYEVLANSDLVHNYLLPVFQRLLGRLPRQPRVLSLGCGVGIDIDLLAEAGFEIVGIDCGNRCQAWSQREHKHRLYRANGKHLPFENSLFDIVYCGCVFPHVGVKGDSREVLPNYYEQRLTIAREMARVLHPDGFIMVSSPNRLFPLDIFHGRTAEHPYPYLNPPTNPFLLSAGDYRSMFHQAGCNVFRLLPVVGYWGFINMTKTWKGRVLAFPVQAVSRLVSVKAFRALRGSPISPWLVGLVRKRHVDYSPAW
jgi:SAM-dependent methyltransferase